MPCYKNKKSRRDSYVELDIWFINVDRMPSLLYTTNDKGHIDPSLSLIARDACHFSFLPDCT